MNRLVIIGNGFDLAHGLPTSYKDFIDDFWKCFKDNCKNDLYKQIIITNDAYDRFYKHYKEINNFKDFKSNLFEYCKDYRYDFYDENCVAIYNMKDIFRIKNDFFLKINNESIENWIDIENLYYSELKRIVKSKCLNVTKTEEYWKKQQRIEVEKLNQEFEQVKNLLKNYLKEKVVEKYNFKSINSDFHDIFFPDILEDLKIDSWIKDFSKEDKDYINELINQKKQDQVKLRFLNFNYTPTLSIYFHMNRSIYSDSEFFIHGNLKDSNNKINFGFGDEMDEDYKLIENIDDNEYLKNFKSFQYLQNDTYKKLMDFVESEKFEVFIMGSSCGLSDRTLLNTIFEHENCRLIKVFYYQWEENGEKKDNFTELTQNISRHFNDKKLMRSKIVHKKLEHLMPKIQLPKI
jgi:hypothetical protein